MKELVAAKRYSRALFELALELGELDRLLADLKKICDIVSQFPVLIKGLSDDRVQKTKRIKAAGDISLLLELGETVQNALKLLISSGRIAILDLVAKDCIARVEKYHGLAVSRAAVANEEESADLKKRIEDVISTSLKLKARCDTQVDPELIGGFAVWLGNMRYDASIKGKLERLKEELIKR